MYVTDVCMYLEISYTQIQNDGWLKCCFTSTETVGLLGMGAQDIHLDLHTAPELCREW